MGPGGSEIEQPRAVTAVVDRQIDELLTGIAKKEKAERLPKTRTKRAGRGKKERRRVVVTGMGAVMGSKKLKAISVVVLCLLVAPLLFLFIAERFYVFEPAPVCAAPEAEGAHQDSGPAT
jgi:hypothetical protein